jgi:hypothetical protein
LRAPRSEGFQLLILAFFHLYLGTKHTIMIAWKCQHVPSLCKRKPPGGINN